MRPLSLRNTNIKVIASVLAGKLARAARKAVPSSRRGFLKRRIFGRSAAALDGAARVRSASDGPRARLP
eukprot:3148895-Pyramimonas_sp.AAC.1